jgi:hypothetical protein
VFTLVSSMNTSRAAHAEIICSGLTNIIATFYSEAGGTSGTMLHLDLSLNGQHAIFLSYDPSPDAAKGLTGGLPMPELQLNIKALKTGQPITPSKAGGLTENRQRRL